MTWRGLKSEVLGVGDDFSGRDFGLEIRNIPPGRDGYRVEVGLSPANVRERQVTWRAVAVDGRRRSHNVHEFVARRVAIPGDPH